MVWFFILNFNSCKKQKTHPFEWNGCAFCFILTPYSIQYQYNSAEYSICYTILNADNITMGKRNEAIRSILDCVQETLDSRSAERLLDEAGTQAALDKKIKELAQTTGFEDAYACVSRDISYNDTRVALTGDEMDFLKVTLEATSQEFIAKHQNDNGLSTLRYRIEKQTGETAKGKNISVFELLIDYNITYSVLNDTKLTVGERDCVLRAVKHGLENFVDGRTIDELANGKAELETEITNLEQQYSSNKMQVTINIISYQAFDQRDEIQSLQ